MDFENFLLGVRNVWDKLQASSPSPEIWGEIWAFSNSEKTFRMTWMFGDLNEKHGKDLGK